MGIPIMPRRESIDGLLDALAKCGQINLALFQKCVELQENEGALATARSWLEDEFDQLEQQQSRFACKQDEAPRARPTTKELAKNGKRRRSAGARA